jgi:CheY-like chemotaxis protein
LATWLVVEDEPDIYEVLLAMFEIWGIEGAAFVDGAEAAAWVDDVDKGIISTELPELAILDIRLPGLMGPEVGARIRQSKVLGNIAVVLITAYRLLPDEEEQVKARAGADMLMYKPLPAMPDLRRTLDNIIAKRKTAAPIHAALASGSATTVPQVVPNGKSEAKAEEKPASKLETGQVAKQDAKQLTKDAKKDSIAEPPREPNDASSADPTGMAAMNEAKLDPPLNAPSRSSGAASDQMPVSTPPISSEQKDTNT